MISGEDIEAMKRFSPELFEKKVSNAAKDLAYEFSDDNLSTLMCMIKHGADMLTDFQLEIIASNAMHVWNEEHNS